jgi:hypothetical protein
MEEFILNAPPEEWASKRRQGAAPKRLRQILLAQKGLCAFSNIPLLFDVAERTPQLNGRGCHPLSPAVDHIDPGNPQGGHQIICYALNDLKGHLSVECFEALHNTEAWKTLMLSWKEQAERDPSDTDAFMRLLRPNAKSKKKKQRKSGDASRLCVDSETHADNVVAAVGIAEVGK